ncbi:MAG: AAA family ATPase [Bacteriovoracaceae bacterium]|nr:AAA family ATPase [Bacteriovoracaceae bacterium]
MSASSASAWLLSQNQTSPRQRENAKTIAVTSGKGGVGKTSVSIKLSKLLAKSGKRVLLIDCDYNLSNTHLKLNLPVASNFYALISAEKPFDECIHKDGNFHLLSGCNGNIELFERGLELDRLIIDIISEHQHQYDYILLDSPAGIGKDNLTLNAYCDERFVVITPDKSSITDSYSLMKILSTKYGINENHLLINKVSSDVQYHRMIKIMGETVEKYLNGRLHVLGSIRKVDKAVDLFDGILLEDENSALHENFVKIINKMTEETGVKQDSISPFTWGRGQEVQPMTCQGVL